MTGLPTLVVELDDGTGTYPHDISQYVRLPASVSITRGRGDEFSEVQPSTLTLTLDNIDGRFTYGSGTYNCAIDQGIRVSYLDPVGGSPIRRFTGYVQGWPASWPGGGDTYSVVEVTATDQMPRWARRQLDSTLYYEIALDGPVLYFPLDDEQGSSSATPAIDRDMTGTRLVPAGTGPDPTFGDEHGAPTDGGTGLLVEDGKGMAIKPGLDLTGSAWTIEAVVQHLDFDSTAYTVWVAWFADPGFGGLMVDAYLRSSGIVSAQSDSVYGYVDPYAAHHIAIVRSGATLTLYADGTAIGTASVYVSTAPKQRAVFADDGVTGTKAAVSHWAYYDTALSAARIAAHATAALTGWVADSSDDRMARYMDYGGVPASILDLEAGAQTAVPHADTSGNTLADMAARVAKSEGGLLFVAGDGSVTLQSRHHRVVQQTASPVTITAADLDADAAISTDTQLLVNSVTYTAATGRPQLVEDSGSIGEHDVYSESDDLMVATQDEALSAATWRVAGYSEPRPRLASVSVDLLTSSAALQSAMANLELSDRLRVTGLPSQAPASTLDLVVEGWTETLSADAWSMAITTSTYNPAGSGWLLGDATYGVLGSTTRLVY